MAKEEIVCIDSMICVWGIKEEATEGQEENIEKAKAFLKWLDENNKVIMIPAPVISEILSPIEESDRLNEIMETIEKDFIVGELDAMAAISNSRILNETKDRWLEIYQREGETGIRNKYKIDTQILAIALTKGAKVLYTNDERFRRLADGYIEAKEMPSIGVQKELFDSESNEEEE